MAVNVTVRCEDVRGNAASFVAEVRVYVDETLVETRSHDTAENLDWSFTIPLDLTGSHTIRVTDVAASGPQEYLVAEQTVACGAPELSESTTTSVSEPSADSTLVPASGDGSTSSTVGPEPMRSTTPLSVAEASTTLPVTVQTGSITAATSTTAAGSTTTTTTSTSTTAVHPPFLPATGPTSGPLVGSGIGLIFAGALALTISTRRFRRSID